MIHLSIQVRQALVKAILPVLFLLSFLIMMLGLAQPKVVENVRLKVTDFLAPAYALVEQPFEKIQSFLKELLYLGDLTAENRRLREENIKLRRWYHTAMGLAEENATLKNQLHWIPEPTPSFVTARVVMDASGIYNKAVLVALGPNHNVHSFEIVLDASGLVGRVTEVGNRSARILLINDNSSRIPVVLMASHAQAIMAGDNSLTPRLIFYPEDNHPIEGEKVTTDSQTGALPSGIPIGIVHYEQPGKPVVIPYATLDNLTLVRIFDYGINSIVAPDAPTRALPSSRLRRGPVAKPSLLGRG